MMKIFGEGRYIFCGGEENGEEGKGSKYLENENEFCAEERKTGDGKE